MAGFAGLRLHLSMKPRMGLHVSAGFLMTIQTALVLGRSIELHVALGAVLFPLGMRLGKFSWGHDGLNALRIHPSRTEQNKKANTCLYPSPIDERRLAQGGREKAQTPRFEPETPRRAAFSQFHKRIHFFLSFDAVCTVHSPLAFKLNMREPQKCAPAC